MDEGVGPIAGYRWLEHETLDLRAVVPALDAHASRARVLVACLDSGPVGCTEEERATGWSQAPAGIVSPPLTAAVTLPWQHYDEWWVFASAAAAEQFPEYDFFVNNGGWSLRRPKDIVASLDPTWEKDAYDWLYDYQARFWDLVDAHRPLAYIANGDRLIVAASGVELLAAIQASFGELGSAARR